MKKMTLLAMIVLLVSACSSSLKVEVKSGITVEYGSDLKVENLTDQKDISVKEIKNFDTKKIGDQKITVVFANNDGKEANEEITVSVKDTKAPVIELNKDKVEITAGDKFDAKANVKSVKDPVDGDIKYSDVKDLSKDGHQITGTVDSKKAGDYKLKVVAYDKNGNKAEKNFSVKVKEKPKEETSANTQTQSNNYKTPSTNQSNKTQASTPSNNNQQASTPAPTPSKTVCPRTGQAPRDPSKSCDAVLDWQYANPHKLFDNFDVANQWGWDQAHDENSPYWGKGYVTGQLCTNDGYCEWGFVSFE